jgi:hypothetical protein
MILMAWAMKCSYLPFRIIGFRIISSNQSLNKFLFFVSLDNQIVGRLISITEMDLNEIKQNGRGSREPRNLHIIAGRARG